MKNKDDKSTLQEAVEHLKNGGAIENDNLDVGLLKKILSIAFPQDKNITKGSCKFYWANEKIYWYSDNEKPTDKIIKLSNITDNSECACENDLNCSYCAEQELKLLASEHPETLNESDQFPDVGNMVETNKGKAVEEEKLHPDSENLLRDVFEQLRLKMIRNQQKYGWSNEWLTRDWEDECREEMMRHIQKGDPKDVAIYAMFMMYRNWPTSTKSELNYSAEMQLLNTISQTFGKENFVDAYVDQDFVEEIATEAIRFFQSKELEVAASLLKECEGTIKWLVENCKPEEDRLYSDFFNIPQNTLSQLDNILSNQR